MALNYYYYYTPVAETADSDNKTLVEQIAGRDLYNAAVVVHVDGSDCNY